MAKNEANKTINIGHLSDFDWKLKLALESNTVSQLNAPIVELTLDSRLTNDEQAADSYRNSYQVEMDCQRLEKLINSIHAALAAASSSCGNENFVEPATKN